MKAEIFTYNGKRIDLLNPKVADIDINDIVIALGNTCRFGGRLPDFYSVAQHSVIVALLAPVHLRLPALLHDAPEAYLHDIVTALKQYLGDPYTELEERYEKAICEKFHLPHCSLVRVKEYDNTALKLEIDAIYEGNPTLLRRLISHHLSVGADLFWSPTVAQEVYGAFLRQALMYNPFYFQKDYELQA